MNNVLDEDNLPDEDYYNSYEYRQVMKQDNPELCCDDESQHEHGMYLEAMQFSENATALPVDLVVRRHVMLF